MRKIDPSFEAWFIQSNNLNEKQIKKIYDDEISDRKSSMSATKDKSKKKNLKAEISKLKAERAQKIKELKKANEQILAFKKFRKAFKTCEDAIDYANAQFDKKKLDDNFLQKYEKLLLNRKNPDQISDWKEYSAAHLKEKTKNMINETKKELNNCEKGKKWYNCMKLYEVWYRRLLSSFGFTKSKDVRSSDSLKFDLKGDNDLSNWMENNKNFIDNKKLSDIVIPASHDSGGYSMKPLSGTDIFGKAAQTHTVNFAGQLKAGIRYFDIRMELENGIPVLSHGPVRGATAAEAFRPLLKFLESHKNELVIVEISHTSKKCLSQFDKLPVVKELVNKYKYNLEDNKIGNICLKNIIDSGKNLIMFNKKANELIMDEYNEAIRNSRNDKLMVDNELENLENNYKENKTKQILHKVTPTHCGTGKDVILPGSYWKPLWYAKHKSKNNYKQMLDNENFKQHANVVSYDDAEGSLEFTKKLIELNSKRKEEKEVNKKVKK